MSAQIFVFPGNDKPGKLETSSLSMGNLVILLKQKQYWKRMNDNERQLIQIAEQVVMKGKDWNEIAYYRALTKIHHRLLGQTLLGRLRRQLFGDTPPDAA